MDPIILGLNSPDQSEGEGQCYLDPMLRLCGKNEAQIKFIKKKILSSPDNNVAHIYYLFMCTAYCIKHFWDLKKCIKIKAVQQGEIE